MRKHRVFLDWNNRRFYICIFITGCFSFLVLITHLDSLCALWLTLPFKSGTDYSESRLPTWFLNLPRVEPWSELPSQCFLVQPLIGPLKAWFTHFSVIHQLRYLVLQKLFLCIMFRYWHCLIHTRYYGHGNSRQYYNIGGFKSTALGVTLRLGFLLLYFSLYYLDKMINFTWLWFLTVGIIIKITLTVARVLRKIVIKRINYKD